MDLSKQLCLTRSMTHGENEERTDGWKVESPTCGTRAGFNKVLEVFEQRNNSEDGDCFEFNIYNRKNSTVRAN